MVAGGELLVLAALSVVASLISKRARRIYSDLAVIQQMKLAKVRTMKASKP